MEEEWELNQRKMKESENKNHSVAREAAKEAQEKDHGLEWQAVFQGAVHWYGKGENAVAQECELLALTGSVLSSRAGQGKAWAICLEAS